MLGAVLLVRQSATPTQVVATFPASSPQSGFAPGDYFVKVTFLNGSLAIFAATLGAVGPQGTIRTARMAAGGQVVARRRVPMRRIRRRAGS